MFCVYDIEVLLYSSSLPQANTAFSFSLWWWKFILTHKLAPLPCHIQQTALRNDRLCSLLAGDVKRKDRENYLFFWSSFKHPSHCILMKFFFAVQFGFLIRVNIRQNRTGRCWLSGLCSVPQTLHRYAFLHAQLGNRLSSVWGTSVHTTQGGRLTCTTVLPT